MTRLLLHILIVILALSLQFQVYSQSSSKQLHNLILDNTRVNPDKAIDDAKKLLSLAKDNNSYDTIAMAYMYLAKAGRVKGTYKQSLEYADLGIKFAQNNNVSKTVLAELYLTKANNLADSGSMLASATEMFKGFEIAEESGDKRTKALLNHGLGYIYFASQNYDKSKEILKQNIGFIEQNKLYDRKSFEVYYKAMVLLSNVYIYQKKNDSALAYLEKGLKHVLTTEDSFTSSGKYKKIGDIYLENNKLQLAYKNLLKSRELGRQIGNTIIESETDYSIALYHFKKGEYDESIAELQKIVENYKQESRKELIAPNVFKLLAENYKKLGNLEKANENYENYVLNYQSNQVNSSELSGIVHNKELTDLLEEQEDQKKITNYLLAGGILIIAALLWYLFHVSNKRNKEKQYFEELIAKIQSAENYQKLPIVDTKDEILEEASSLDISNEITQEILEGLAKMESQEYFLRQDCNAYNVAKKIKTNTSYLSKVVNSSYQKNFNTYINDLRINYAVLRLKNDSQFRSYSVQSIANELGYKSADSFTKYFKKHTGLNPSFYIKRLNSIA